MRSPWRAAALALALGACGARAEPGPRPITVDAKAIPLNPGVPSQTQVGRLTYVGGLSLKSNDKGFGGLSGLILGSAGALMAVSDAGDLLQARLRFDAAGRPTGLEDATLTRLRDESGQAYASKMAADAEDLTALGDGRFAVSFEQDHRVVIYEAGRSTRRLPPPPGANLGPNTGLEALTAWTDATGSQRLVMGAERGDAWSCDLSGQDCRQILDASRDSPGKGFRLTSLTTTPDGALLALYRAASLIGGLRAVIAQVRPEAHRPVTELARLSGGVSVDNMEGIAALPGANGSTRIYVLSDDNFTGWQRTLLMAFDWPRTSADPPVSEPDSKR